MLIKGLTYLRIITTALICTDWTAALQCHSCSGESACVEVITHSPARSGKCEIGTGAGKCFIRKDPNKVVYWGCIDDSFWPGVPWRVQDACWEDWERAWVVDGVRTPLIWCFCSEGDCNVSIDSLNTTDRGTTSSLSPSYWMSSGTLHKEFSERVSLEAVTLAEDTPSGESSTSSTTEISAECPESFIKSSAMLGESCYYVVTPTRDLRGAALNRSEAQAYCSRYSGSNLVSVDSIDELRYLASILKDQTIMLEGWQGWWTSGRYSSPDGDSQGGFMWHPSLEWFSEHSILWGFLRKPLLDTCVWVMSIPHYNYTLANYDCSTKSGFICEYSFRNSSLAT